MMNWEDRRCSVLLGIVLGLVLQAECNPARIPLDKSLDLSHNAKIFKVEPWTPKSIYKPNLELTCFANSSQTVYWRWVRNDGQHEIPLGGLLPQFDDSTTLTSQKSTITLGPTDEPESNYTCKAYTSFDIGAEDSHTFRVVNSGCRCDSSI